MKINHKEPLLIVGAYGLHILHNPAGTYSFVGTVPIALDSIVHKTEEEAQGAFVDWFNSLPLEDRAEYRDLLRADIQAKVA